VQSGDNFNDLDYKATDSLSANGGTIRDNASNDATLTLASPGATNSLASNKALVFGGWKQEAYIKAANNDAEDGFGGTPFSVSIDGDTLAVGAWGEDSNQTTITNGTSASSNNINYNSGAVYVYKRSGSTWAQEAYIKAANNDEECEYPYNCDEFGWSTSIDKDTLAVGASNEDSNQTTITNGTGASSNDSNISSGAVYVYKRSGSTWAQEAYIKAANNDVAINGDTFGKVVSIDGDTLAVGVHFEDSNQTTITNGTGASSNDSNISSGAVYVYKRSGSTWAQEAYIKADNNDVAINGDTFGKVVSIDGDTLAVGVHFEDSNQTTITNGTGTSSNNSNISSGAVYVYKRSGSTWAQEAYIKADNNDAGDFFGTSVSIDNDTLVVGAPKEESDQSTITNGTSATDDNSRGESGAVYVYKRSGSTWAQEAYIKAANNVNYRTRGSRFGEDVSIDGDTLAVGVSQENNSLTTITNGTSASTITVENGSSGAVFVYKRSGTNWAQQAYIKASNADAGDLFGSSVSIDGDILAVGAYVEKSNQNTITNGTGASNDDNNTLAGAVYVYKRSDSTWAQEAYIKAANNDAGDYFGYSVSIDNGSLAVSSSREYSNQTTITNGTSASSNNSNAESGAVYVYSFFEK
jgi:hypothetical protein